jgi:ribosomal protein S18 acetylase RimI-like enzyme
MRIAEIMRLRKSDYEGGKQALDSDESTRKQFEPLPGQSGLLYSVSSGRYTLVITLWDPDAKHPPAPRREQFSTVSTYQYYKIRWEKLTKLPVKVGKLELNKIDHSFPLKGAVQVDTITVDEDYRGAGIAKALYGVALSILRLPLIAGNEQTPGGMRIWVSLNNIPGVELAGYVVIDEVAIDDAPELPDILFKKLGAQYIGQAGVKHFFAFPVRPSISGKELEATVKNKLAQVYHRDYSSQYGPSVSTGLFARWVG